MLANEDMLIVKNQFGEDYFMAFSLPDFTLIKSFGRNEKGPGELTWPSLITSIQPEHLLSINDMNGRIYHVNRLFEVIDSKISLDTERQLYDHNKICVASDEEFYYVGTKEFYIKPILAELSLDCLDLKTVCVGIVVHFNETLGIFSSRVS